MIRLVLFDIDGTLIRTGGAGQKAFEEAFRDGFGIGDATRSMSFAGRTDTSLVREGFLLHQIPTTPENFQKFFEVYLRWLEVLLKRLNGEVCPGVHEFMTQLERLESPPAIGLLTGNIRRGAELKLGHYGLWNHFSFGGFGDDHEERNRIAEIALARGRERLGNELTGEEVLVIGDTPLDIACARAIKARVLAVGTGQYTAEELAVENPCWVAPTLEHLSARELCLS